MGLKMEAMDRQLAERATAERKAKSKTSALKELTDKGMPTGLLDYVIADTEEATLEKVNGMSEIIEGYIQNIKSEKLKNNNTIVPTNEGTPSGGLEEPQEGASKQEWATYWKNKNKGAK